MPTGNDNLRFDIEKKNHFQLAAEILTADSTEVFFIQAVFQIAAVVAGLSIPRFGLARFHGAAMA